MRTRAAHHAHLVVQIEALALGVCLGCLPEVRETVDELVSPIERDRDTFERVLNAHRFLRVIESSLAFECPLATLSSTQISSRVELLSLSGTATSKLSRSTWT